METGTDWPEIEPGSLHWKAGDHPPEPWHGLTWAWSSCS